MPLGKYYCDYCDKEFQDTTFARKRHLQGIQHQRAKTHWFNSQNDINHSFNDAFPKGFCNRFVNTGFCPYGDSCKYLHPNSVPQNTTAPGLANNAQSSVNRLVAQTPGDQVRDSMGMSWTNLPPSLRPPPEGGYPSLPFVDWG